MKAIILGKSSDARVKNKNYRNFYNDESLVDILIKKLCVCICNSDIYLSCEDEKYKIISEKWGIQFLHRERELAQTSTQLVDLVHDICRSIPGNSDILWTTPMEPLFDEYIDIINCWNNADKNIYDSLNLVYPKKKYMLDQNFRPIGFGFGVWHKPIKDIPPIYELCFSTAIMSQRCIKNTNYIVGSNPYWYDCYSELLSIDTEEDWHLAQAIYRNKQESSKSEAMHG